MQNEENLTHLKAPGQTIIFRDDVAVGFFVAVENEAVEIILNHKTKRQSDHKKLETQKL